MRQVRPREIITERATEEKASKKSKRKSIYQVQKGWTQADDPQPQKIK